MYTCEDSLPTEPEPPGLNDFVMSPEEIRIDNATNAPDAASAA